MSKSIPNAFQQGHRGQSSKFSGSLVKYWNPSLNYCFPHLHYMIFYDIIWYMILYDKIINLGWFKVPKLYLGRPPSYSWSYNSRRTIRGSLLPSTGVSRAQTPMIGRLHSARCPVSTTFSRSSVALPRCLDAMWTTGSGRSLFRQFSNSWAIMLWLWRLWLEKPWKNYEKTMDSTWKETHGTIVFSGQKWTGKPMVTVVMISWLLWESWETSLGSENRVHPEFMRLSCSYRKWHLIGYSYFQTHPSKNKAESVIKLTIPGIDFGQQYSSRNQAHPPTWTSDKKRCSNYLLRKVLYSRRHGQETTFNYSSTIP